jgi:hypothetical protein
VRIKLRESIAFSCLSFNWWSFLMSAVLDILVNQAISYEGITFLYYQRRRVVSSKKGFWFEA